MDLLGLLGERKKVFVKQRGEGGGKVSHICSSTVGFLVSFCIQLFGIAGGFVGANFKGKIANLLYMDRMIL